MQTKNLRVNVVLDRPLHEAIRQLARREGTSVSRKARDLLRDALKCYEDFVLDWIAEERELTFDRVRALSHREAWRPPRIPKPH